MEEKKKRPRILKVAGDPEALKERSAKAYSSAETNRSDPGYEKKPTEAREERNEDSGFNRKPWEDRGSDRKPWEDRGSDRKPWEDRGADRPPRADRGGYDRKPWYDRTDYGSGYDRPPRDERGGYDRKPWQDRSNDRGGYERRSWQDRSNDRGGYDRPPRDDRGGYDRKPWQDRSNDRGGYDRPPRDDRGGYDRKPWQDRSNDRGGYERKPWQDRGNNRSGGRPSQRGGAFGKKQGGKKLFNKKEQDFHVERKPKPVLSSGDGMTLNKYLAHCGLASRRKAVDFIREGEVTVNGEKVLEPYYRIQPGDVIAYKGETVAIQERLVYLLLNKPKNIITTTSDEFDRPTIMDIVDPHYPERLYPVGRLDRETTGLILITNDGDLAQRMTHPSYRIVKQYRVGLDRGLQNEDLKKLEEGIQLDDGLAKVNWIRFAEDHPDRNVAELEIVMGRNRVVRRMFEHLGYEVRKLDRFYLGGLTKRDLPRGSFRELTNREIIMLKHFTGHLSTGGGEQSETPGLQEPDAPGAE